MRLAFAGVRRESKSTTLCFGRSLFPSTLRESLPCSYWTSKRVLAAAGLVMSNRPASPAHWVKGVMGCQVPASPDKTRRGAGRGRILPIAPGPFEASTFQLSQWLMVLTGLRIPCRFLPKGGITVHSVGVSAHPSSPYRNSCRWISLQFCRYSGESG